MLQPYRFNELFVVELLQNIHEYFFVLTIEVNLFCNFTIQTHLNWKIDRLFLKWPKHFANTVYVLERLEENDLFFGPGSTANGRLYYNTLIRYGKKTKKI